MLRSIAVRTIFGCTNFSIYKNAIDITEQVSVNMAKVPIFLHFAEIFQVGEF
jgi:hypothetical protein